MNNELREVLELSFYFWLCNQTQLPPVSIENQYTLKQNDLTAVSYEK